MTRSKEPVFKGIKKGYSAFWIGEPDLNKLDPEGYTATLPSNSRLRVLTSKGKWGWFDGTEAPYLLCKGYTSEKDLSPPCWLRSYPEPVWKQVGRMKHYDWQDKRETIFIGYVKE